MAFIRIQQLKENKASYIFKDAVNGSMLHALDNSGTNPKLLKCWIVEKWLPVPEDSEAQQIIRRANWLR
jgi:hypothetical protein